MNMKRKKSTENLKTKSNHQMNERNKTNKKKTPDNALKTIL